MSTGCYSLPHLLHVHHRHPFLKQPQDGELAAPLLVQCTVSNKTRACWFLHAVERLLHSSTSACTHHVQHSPSHAPSPRLAPLHSMASVLRIARRVSGMLPQWLPHWADVLMARHGNVRTKRGQFSAYTPDPCTSVSLAIQQQPVCGVHLLPDCYPPSTDATSCRALYMKQ